ncbi:hypothetical protein G7Y89_g15300 [Cudoniella acicularis]|uniref:Uncharacterized protein n=1 Tax=Cudoniella acicularis TaxID=354080 RepID=A0A8H4VPH0_9HELO|nr:hypothetical protein G7Y89_g15300 [Cudoniella acicularis]
MVPEYLSLIIGLEALAERIIREILSLPGTCSRFAKLGEELQTLIQVLESVSKHNPALTRCIQDAKATCEDIDKLVKKIVHSKVPDLKGSWAKKPMRELCERLEGNKSTLNIQFQAMGHEDGEEPPKINALPIYTLSSSPSATFWPYSFNAESGGYGPIGGYGPPGGGFGGPYRGGYVLFYP